MPKYPLWKAGAAAAPLRYGFRMRRAPVLLLAVTAALALGGCVAEPPVVIPDETASIEPVFASDEEALAAAEEALVAYYQVSDQIIIEGGVSPERLEDVATTEISDREAAGYKQLTERGWVGVGATSVDSVELQQLDQSAGVGDEVVTVYACVDISGFDLVDSSGTSVTSASRVLRTPFEIGFTRLGEDASGLVLSRKDAWTGEDFCAE